MGGITGNVMFGYIHNGLLRGEFVASLVGVLHGPQRRPEIGCVAYACGTRISVNRNRLTTTFLASPMQWLWMVDSDVTFGPQTLPVLMAATSRRCHVVSAVYHTVNPGIPFSPQLVKGPAAYKKAEDGTYGHIVNLPAGPVVRVDAVGAGCLLVHRRVFEEIADISRPEVWWREIDQGSHLLGEDLSFCVRVAEAGYPIYVHSGVQVGHMKTAQIGEVSL